MKAIFIFMILFSINAQANMKKCLKKWNGTIPKQLSKTCLYKSLQHDQINSEILAFTPKYPLYTDGMDKRRWIYLPSGTQINNSDLDNWNFPKGTVLWKEFSTKGQKLETRILVKKSETTGRSAWDFATFKWKIDQTDADYITEGARDVNGTVHDIPKLSRCFPCHTGTSDIVRGFDPIQLSFTDANANSNEVYLKSLIKSKTFSHKMNEYFKIPARDEVERKALGYMHGNCGHCHNEQHGAGRNVGLLLKVKPSHKTRADLDSIKTTVNVHTSFYNNLDYRIIPNNSVDSAIYHRLNSNQRGTMMAPIGRELIDTDGVEKIDNWINSL